MWLKISYTSGILLASSILTASVMASLSVILSSAELTFGSILLYQNTKFKEYLEALSLYGLRGFY